METEKNREAAHIGAVIDEENERKRRFENDKLLDDRDFHVENFDYVNKEDNDDY